MKQLIKALILSLILFVNAGEAMTDSIYDIEVNTITGEQIALSSYSNKTVLIVNTASKCGFTGQFEGLQKLYERYADQGLIILGFPSNDFLWQEPKSNEEIQQFCTLNYGVTFPMFEKIHVKGRKQHPLYAYLTASVGNPDFAGSISWNFNKFLIDRTGTIVNRFGSKVTPDSPELIAAIENALNENAPSGE